MTGSGTAMILTYHSLDTSGSVISVAPEAFRSQMEFLMRSGIPVVPLASLRTTPGAVAITFDDGFENFYTDALPVLTEYNLPATVFVVTDYCGGSNGWPSQSLHGIPRRKLMDWTQLREAASCGITLGAHTATHPHLPELPLARAEEEIRRSKHDLEERTGTPVETFAYPYGDTSRAVRDCAAGYFRFACGTALGMVNEHSDPIELPRIDMYYFRNSFWFKSLWSLRGRAYLALRRTLRAARQAQLRLHPSTAQS